MPGEDKSCWTCDYQDLASGITFLGFCTWFERNGKGENKEIPPDKVDSGCRHWQEKGAH